MGTKNNPGAARFEAMSPNDRGEAAQMIAQKQKEIG